jgi:hypothetical protein
MSFALQGMNTFLRYDPQVENFRQSFYQKPRVLKIADVMECFEVRQPAKRNFNENKELNYALDSLRSFIDYVVSGSA